MLMPASVVGSAYFLLTSDDGISWLLPVGSFFWFWSLKNRTLGPIWIDGGIVTYLPGILTAVANTTLNKDNKTVSMMISAFAAASSTLVALNYSMPVMRFLKTKSQYPHNAYPKEKPDWWAAVFHAYCHGGFALWTTGAILAAVRSSSNTAAVLGVAALATGLLASASLALMNRLNAPVKAWIKSRKVKK